MGKKPLSDRYVYNKKMCADNGAPFCNPGLQAYQMTCNCVIDFFRIENQRPPGASRGSYGSELWYTRFWQSHTLPMLREYYREMTGKELIGFLPDDELRTVFMNARKNHFKELRDKVPIVDSGCPLFGDKPLKTCVIYAYSGKLAKFTHRVVKIGYTNQKLQKYLRSMERQFNPKELAKRAGTTALEDIFHDRWECKKADGREWYFPVAELFDWIHAHFTFITDDFDAVRHEAQQSYGGNQP